MHDVLALHCQCIQVMKTNQSLPLAIAVLLSLFLSTLCMIYYVTPNETTPCPRQPCHNLSYYISESRILSPDTRLWLYGDDSTVISFLPGVHILDIEASVYFILANNLTLTGSSEVISAHSDKPSSEVVCASRSMFAFIRCSNVVVQKLSFISCGTQLSSVVGSVIHFEKVANFRILNMLIQNSSGYAITAYNTLGESLISHSKFLYNNGTVELSGGHVYIVSILDDSDCQQQNILEWKFTVESSVLAYGNTYSDGGLVFVLTFLPCVHREVEINNVTLLWNTAGSSGIGGNLAFILQESNSYCNGNFVASSVINRITVKNSVIEEGMARSGGGAALAIFQESLNPQKCISDESSPHNELLITNSTFVSNKAYKRGGGLWVQMEHLCSGYELYLMDVTFLNNEVLMYDLNISTELPGDIDTGVGGNVAIYTYRLGSLEPLHTVTLYNCSIQSGKAPVGAGMGIFTLTSIHVEDLCNLPKIRHENVLILLVNTDFVNNKGVAGGGMCVISSGVVDASQSFGNTLRVQNSTFSNNTGYAGAAVYILTNDVFPYALHNRFVIQQVSFLHNHHIPADKSVLTLLEGATAQSLRIDTNASVAVVVQGVSNVTFIDSEFLYNNGTGILAIQSNVFFKGNILFKGNVGKNGGGLSLFGSFMFPKPHTRIEFVENHAIQAGGGILVEREHSPLYSIYCFIQPDVDVLYYNSLSEMDIQIIFKNNTADYAGSELYGGYIDGCLLINSAAASPTDGTRSRFVFLTNLPGYSTEIFNSLFLLANSTGLSAISSNPIGVCVCEHNQPNCELKTIMKATYPGGTIEVLAVVVGQRNGVVPGIVHAEFHSNYSSDSHSLRELQVSQMTGKSCTFLKYTLFSRNGLENVELSVEQPAPSSHKSPFIDYFLPPILSLTMLPCPLGFNLTGNPPKCDCVASLRKWNITCNITDQTIHCPVTVWIGYYHKDNTKSSDGVLIHRHCPFDYCKTEGSKVNLEYPDEQCAFNHSGILCGGCRAGLSLMLGTSQCAECLNSFLSLLVAFAAAGFALVLLVMVSNLTVTEGAVNGLIFYANIIHINHAAFFPQGDTSVPSVFMAWLNLDLGIQTCFYTGMDIYAKTWLQLVFPVYIWLIALVMIISSHYSTRATRLIPRNVVKVLATLFLLSYTKILRMIISALSFTYLAYPDRRTTALWLYDGNVEYLKGKHIPLFVMALLILLFLSFPYTLLLLFVRYLYFKCPCFTWINKQKPLLDAYTGPYRDKYRFWTGLLLLVRNVLFLVFAFNALGNPDLNLLAIGLASASLLLFGWVCGGVYKLWPLNILESFSFLNLAAVSLSTMYVRHAGGNQAAIIYTSTCTAFATFAVIFLYYTARHIALSRQWKKCINWKNMRPQLLNDRELVDLQLASHDSEESLRESSATVQSLRLTFDENNEAVLVVDET